MADVSYQTWAQKWLSDMASDNPGSGKIDQGPLANKATVVGRRKPNGKRTGSRVPGPQAGQTRKL